ncbi:MAG: DEAD/DEAH box helicase [Balneolaceae bacterium]
MISVKQFSDLRISAPVLKAINEMGFEAPTKIQSAAIPKIIDGSDVAGQAQTGTGKTAAFAIPILDRIDSQSKNVQALVMCPTRELAVQITGEFIKLANHLKGIQITPVYGGQPINRQIRQIKNGTQIVVGTPGRLIDHLQRSTLKLDHLKMVVLDEADEMLNMGFRDDIETILGYSSKESRIQTIMFSATMSAGIKKIMQKWFQNPEMIRVEGEATAADGIEQYILEVRDSMRTDGICRLLDINNYKLALIFCNTKRKCDSLVGEMKSRGYSSDALHGDMSQNVRDKVMGNFRKGKIDILIATDVAARGLDVDDVDVVFNYDIPQDPEYYVHRIGRTGRAGRKGVAYTFSSGRKNKNIRYIEKQLKMKLNTIPLPSVKDVETSRIEAFLEDVMKTLEAGGLRPYIEQVESMASENFTPIEVAAALLKMRESNSSSADVEKPAKEQNRTKRPEKTRKNKQDEPFYKPFMDKKKGKNTRKRNRKY